MLDQADKLRDLIQSAVPAARDGGWRPPMIVVAGGRAGVGATTVAVNLAAVLADRGERVVLVDAAQQRWRTWRRWPASSRDDRRFARRRAGGQVSGGRRACRRAGGHVDACWTLVAAARCESQTRSRPRAAAVAWPSCRRSTTEVDLLVVDAGSGLDAMDAAVLAASRTGDARDDDRRRRHVLDSYAAIKQSVRRSESCRRPRAGESMRQRRSGRRRASAACRMRASGFLSRRCAALPALPRHVAVELVRAQARAARVGDRRTSPFGHAVLWLGRAVCDVLQLDADRACERERGRRDRAPCSQLTPSSCRDSRIEMIDEMIQARADELPIMCDITPARRCASNWRNCGKFDGTPKERADGSRLRRHPRTAGHGSGDLPRLAGLGRRRRHAHAGDRFISPCLRFVGACLGHIAQATIDESVRTKLEQQLAHQAAQSGEHGDVGMRCRCQNAAMSDSPDT